MVNIREFIDSYDTSDIREFANAVDSGEFDDVKMDRLRDTFGGADESALRIALNAQDSSQDYLFEVNNLLSALGLDTLSAGFLDAPAEAEEDLLFEVSEEEEQAEDRLISLFRTQFDRSEKRALVRALRREDPDLAPVVARSSIQTLGPLAREKLADVFDDALSESGSGNGDGGGSGTEDITSGSGASAGASRPGREATGRDASGDPFPVKNPAEAIPEDDAKAFPELTAIIEASGGRGRPYFQRILGVLNGEESARQYAEDRGLPQADFVREINNLFSEPNTLQRYIDAVEGKIRELSVKDTPSNRGMQRGGQGLTRDDLEGLLDQLGDALSGGGFDRGSGVRMPTSPGEEEELAEIADRFQARTKFDVTKRPQPGEMGELGRRFPTSAMKQAFERFEGNRLNMTPVPGIVDYAVTFESQMEAQKLAVEEFVTAQQQRFIADGTGRA